MNNATEYIAFQPFHFNMAGRDVLENNLTDSEELNKCIKRMSNHMHFHFLSKECDIVGWTIDLDENNFKIAMGVSPRYKDEKLDILIIEQDIHLSRRIIGVSKAYYGTGIVFSEKGYKDLGFIYQLFIHIWHRRLMACL